LEALKQAAVFSAGTVTVFIFSSSVQFIYLLTPNAGCSLQKLMNITTTKPSAVEDKKQSFYSASLSTTPQGRMGELRR
jgi:hypothetical protein